MRKLTILAVIMMAVSACSMPTKLVNSATYKKVAVSTPIVAVFADLEVSENKITYFMMPSKSVVNSGYDNVVNTAVREALLANGDADVLVGLETQVKYDAKGNIESITVSGYPAKYTNFRNVGDDYLKTMPAPAEEKPTLSLGKIKLGKK
jgi:hypothetical protein